MQKRYQLRSDSFKMFFMRSIIGMRRSNQTEEMSFLDHLEELRKTLIRMALVTLLAMAVCFAYTPTLLGMLRQPVEHVWLEHERQYLPDGVNAQNWVLAKELQFSRAGLPPKLRSTVESRLGSDVLLLTDALDILRAASLLPEHEQLSFLKETGDSPAARMALALHNSQADLHTGQGRHEARMMGAFQPGEAFMLSVQLAFFGGVVLASPVLLYLALGFIMPGLLEHERRVLLRSLWWGVLLFLLGCSFAYLAVLPRVLAFFYEYSWTLGIENDWRIGYYLSFAVKLILVFGVIFELPVLLYPLMRLGVLTRKRMRRLRPYVLVGSFAVALVLAPAPDPGTMLLMALPLYFLYELCLLFAKNDNSSSQSSPAAK